MCGESLTSFQDCSSGLPIKICKRNYFSSNLLIEPKLSQGATGLAHWQMLFGPMLQRNVFTE
jgi:hypothetical protein